MARFKITLAQTVIETAVVWIECNTADEAERLAMREATVGFAEFRFAESGGDIEVIGIEESKL